MLLLMYAAVCLGPVAFGQALTPEDRDHGVKHLEQTRDAIVAATNGLSRAQWKFKAAPDKLPIEQTLEHMALAQGYIFGAAENTLGMRRNRYSSVGHSEGHTKQMLEVKAAPDFPKK